MTDADKNREAEFIEQCRTYQGERLLPGSGSGSWATTYADEFIDAATALYLLYKNMGVRSPLASIAAMFREAGIKSCRGAEMSIVKVEYLYKTHLLKKLRAT
ncbi:hypothetical protein [Geobacter sulfurreducens]|uniref:hypothetical protein n=1 Tax=Geobacter sulfurreducens TaxID=35554 RepID=UPI0011AE74BD|nr:hypothetical protein [Geobacter sulfurreducens]